MKLWQFFVTMGAALLLLLLIVSVFNTANREVETKNKNYKECLMMLEISPHIGEPQSETQKKVEWCVEKFYGVNFKDETK